MGYLFSFFLGAMLALGGYAYWVRERPLSPEAFSQKIVITDQIIQSQLYEIGISKKNVLLRQSSSKKEGDFAWERSLLKIQIPSSLSFPKIESEIRQNLSILGKSVSIESSQQSDSLQMEVKVMNRVTHQVTFLYSKPPTPLVLLRPRIAIVIDDIGGENHLSQELLHLDFPLTFSVLPFTPHSKTFALEARRKGKEILLHLPMEPHDYPNIKPGRGALLQEMNEESLLRQLSEDIEAIPYLKGVSNHMGSRLTEDPEKMKFILSELKRRGLFFLDSRTTPQTVSLQIAKSIGLLAMERSLFLDHSKNENDIKKELERLTEIALSKGKAIGIAHPHSSTVKIIKEMVPKMKRKGVELVPLSSLME